MPRILWNLGWNQTLKRVNSIRLILIIGSDLYWIKKNWRSAIRFVIHLRQRPCCFLSEPHPGFQVPITDGEVFEDYMIEFEHPAHPQRLLLDGAYLSGKKEPYPLQNDTIIPLQHNLFDNEMILLEQAARSLTIHSHAIKTAFVFHTRILRTSDFGSLYKQMPLYLRRALERFAVCPKRFQRVFIKAGFMYPATTENISSNLLYRSLLKKAICASAYRFFSVIP